MTNRTYKTALLVAAGLLFLAASGCNRPSPTQSAPTQAQPVAGQPATPAGPKPKTIDPIDADAELVLASMKPQWQAMLAKAEAFDRQEKMGWCMTCHINVQDELRGGKHEKEEISCVECHGPSERHARNENNEVKPDQVFARKAVDRACGECHDCKRTDKTGMAVAAHQVCTDCHKAHKFLCQADRMPNGSAAKTGN